MSKPIVHFDIGCRDKQRADAFYTALFGWKTVPYGPYSLRIDTETTRGIQGFITSLGHEPQNYVMVYVEVEDIGEHLVKIEALGGRVVVPETPVPGGGHFAWVADPDGNLLGLWLAES